MAWFKRSKKRSGRKATSAASPPFDQAPAPEAPRGRMPGVLMPLTDVVVPLSDSGHPSPGSAVAEAHDPAPTNQRSGPDGTAGATANDRAIGRALEPAQEIDPVPRVGGATTFTGKIVADEDLEVHGTVEGSIILDQHELTVGARGLVEADVEARSVIVIGRVTGNVVATDVVEVKCGGVIGGDVMAPRVIMADGAIVIGALDMTAALPKDLDSQEPPTRPPAAPKPPTSESTP
jgi:cytoskeletal protein CcmA (bactofilin family)